MLVIESRFFFYSLFHEKSTFSNLASSGSIRRNLTISRINWLGNIFFFFFRFFLFFLLWISSFEKSDSDSESEIWIISFSLSVSGQKTLSRFDTAHLSEPLPWFSATASTVQTKARIFTAQISPSLLYKYISQAVRLGRHRFDSRRQAPVINRVVIVLDHL